MEKVSKYGDGSNNKELIITDKFGNVKSIFQKKISLTTLGTSGPSTFINNILNVPDYSGSLTGYVPYIGATQNVNLGEYSLQTSQLQFDLTPTGTPGIGIMRWNDQDGTVDLGLKGGNVTLQIGQEQVTRVVNKTGVNLLEANYQSVRISGAQGNRLKVALAQANNDANSAETLGIVTETINDNQEGFITTSGLVRNINTTGSLQGETWSDGDMLYLSGTIAGQLTNIKPTAPVHTIIMGYVVRAHATQGQIYVKVDNGYELDELHNVAITSPLNNQGLFYETATQLWKNKSIDTALGYTPVPTTRTLTINGTTYDLSANRTWSVGTVTSVTASAPLSSSGGTTPNITISQASGSTNGYLSAADWTTFNSKQPAGNYITALSGEASGSGPGTASVTLNNASVTAKVLTGVNITGGSISASDSILTAFGKLQNQINGLIGSSVYQGTWNASTNTPALASGVGTRGYYYIVNVAGSTNLDGITDWNVGDWAIFDGTAWQQVDNTDSVTSVNGQTGAVSLTTDNISEGATNLYFTNLRSRQSISLTTTGTSGAATYNNTTGVLNIPQYQSVLTNPVTGTGTTNYVARWTSSSQIGTGVLYDNGTNVGIGTITPSASLQIANPNGLTLGAVAGNVGTLQLTTTSQGSPVSGRLLFGTDVSGWQFRIARNAGGSITDLFTIQDNGNVGIGSGATTPGFKLQVDGNGFFNDYVFIANGSSLRFTSNNIFIKPELSSGFWRDLAFYTGASEKMRITDGGNIGIGTTGPNSLLSATERVLLIENSNLASLYLSSLAGRKWSMSSAGDGALVWWDLNSVSERMRINSSGNVGIGTSSPSQKLEVAGRALVDTLQYTRSINISSGDLNGVVAAGFYNGEAMTNAPDSGWFWVTVETYSGDYNWVHQTATSFGAGNTANKVYSRVRIGGTWGSWKELADNASVSGTTNYVSKFTSSSTIGNSQIYDNGANVGIGNTNPTQLVDIGPTAAFKALRVRGTYNFDGSYLASAGVNGGAKLELVAHSDTFTSASYRIQHNRDVTTALTFDFASPASSYAGLSYVERMRIDANGNVGIGTTNPLGPLEVYRSAPGSLGGYIVINNDGSSVYNETALMFGDGGANAIRAAISTTTEGSPYYGQINFKTGAGTYSSLYTRMTINGAGNVGIGTTSPSRKLEVTGRAIFTNLGITGTPYWNNNSIELQSSGGQTIALEFHRAGFSSATIFSDNGSIAINTDSGSERFRVAGGTGYVGINTSNPSSRLTLITGSGYTDSFNITDGVGTMQIGHWDTITNRFEFVGKPTYFVQYGSTNYIAFGTQGDERMRISPSGNVGIGTSNPTYKLQVFGTAYINETLYVNGFTTVEDSLRVTGAYYDSNNQAGTSGQILSSTGSGTDWVDSPTATATSVAQLLPSATVTYNWVGQVIDGTWVNIFSRADNILTSGVWTVTMYVSDFGQGGGHYQYRYSGTMTWYQGGTNQSGILAASEIALHRMGHAANSCVIYLRTTEESASDGGNGKLQIKGNYTNTSNTTITFTFVKII